MRRTRFPTLQWLVHWLAIPSGSIVKPIQCPYNRRRGLVQRVLCVVFAADQSLDGSQFYTAAKPRKEPCTLGATLEQLHLIFLTSMANDEHLKILEQGVLNWNDWRKHNPEIEPDLSNSNLSGMRLSRVDLSGANLSRSDLSYSDLGHADLFRADLQHTDLSNSYIGKADLSDAKLIEADLSGVYLGDSKLHRTDLSNAYLWNADLSRADLSGAKLIGAYLSAVVIDTNFSTAHIGWTIFVDLDLSSCLGLDSVEHRGPSTVGIDVFYRSSGKISETFLRNAGVPDDLISYLHSRTAKAIQFYSCFISYSNKDEEFAKRLYSQIRDAHIRVWFAPEDIKGGEKLHEQIDRAIQVHDRLLIVLSENSLQSEWVMTEIRKARKSEIKEGRRKLFPIRLVSMERIRNWECFDSESGKDLAVEVREYFIPDFSDWKNHDAFETAFERLLRDLKANQPT